MKKKAKQLIALLCVVVLVVSMIPADILPVEAANVEENSYPYKQAITDCDSLDASSNIGTMKTTTVTTEDYAGNDYVQEGTGLFKSEITTSRNDNISLYEFNLAETVDVRGYKYFSCKLFISNKTVLNSTSAIGIALSPDENANSRALQFKVHYNELQEGWNNLKLSFAQAEVIRNHSTVDGKDYGTYSGESIHYIRIWQICNTNVSEGALTTYLDDVCVINEHAGLLLADCDQMQAPASTGKNTDNDYAYVQGQSSYVNGDETAKVNTSSIDTTTYKEGIGSLKAQCYKNTDANNNVSYRMLTQIVLSDANKQDISSYVETGALHLWLYLSDVYVIKEKGSFTVELTSSGRADRYEANWTVNKSELHTGWNELIFPLSAYSVHKADGTDGEQFAPNWTAINYFRISTTYATNDAWTSGEYILVDDIRVVERKVFAQTKESGMILPGTTVPTLEGYVFGGYYNSYNPQTREFSSPLTIEREATPDAPVYIRWVPEEVMTVKAQVRQEVAEYDVCKKVLTSCDSLYENANIDTMLTTGVEKCVKSTYVQEGIGSLKSEITTSKTNNTSLYEFTLAEPIDVRGYKYFSCQLYISDKAVLNTNEPIGIALSPSSNANINALHFYVQSSELQEGWNELKLSFAQAETIRNHSIVDDNDYGTYSGEAINYIRIWQRKGSAVTEGILTTYLDDVCVINEYAGLLLADCDQMQAPSSTGKNTDNDYAYVQGQSSYVNGDETTVVDTSSIDTTTYKEGNGSLKAQCYKNTDDKGNVSYRMLTQIVLSDANKQDISSYVGTGYLHLWLYLSDIGAMKTDGSFTVELTSSGSCDKYEANWTVKESELQTGWNELIFPLNSYSLHNEDATNGGQFAPEWTQINYIRVFTTNATVDAWTSGAYMLVDDVRVVDSVPVADCDSTDGISTNNFEGVVLDTTDVKQGTGAFVNNNDIGAKNIHHKLRFADGINFSAFKGRNGSLRFWYYIQDPNLLADDEIIVEISSGSSNGAVSEANQRSMVAKKDLVAGWNEIYINLDDPASIVTGTVDWKNIHQVCIMAASNFTSDCMTKLDDVSLVAGNRGTVDVRFISTVESLGYRKVGFEITQSRSSVPLVTETTDVYKALNAIGEDGVQDSITPADVSGTADSAYMQAATVVKIPNRLWDATFTIVPYWVTLDGTTVRGASKEYTINYMCSVTPKLVCLDYSSGIGEEDYNRDMYGMNAFSESSDVKGNDPGVFYLSEAEDARYGGWYYMYLSQRRETDKLTDVKVMRSKDLYHWQSCGANDGYSLVLADDDWVDPKVTLWAPEVIRNPEDGRYYMYFTGFAKIGHITGVSDAGTNSTLEEEYKDRMFIGVAESDTPVGPFTMISDTDETNGNKIPTMNFQAIYDTPEFIRALDPNPFFDDDGSLYLYFARHSGQYNDKNRICGVQMADMAHVEEETFSYLTQPGYTTVNFVQGSPSAWALQTLEEAEDVSAWTKLEWLVDPSKKEIWLKNRTAEKFTSGCESSDEPTMNINEGPFMVKHDGKYYITFSHDRWRSKDYAVGVAVSDNPLSGFTKLSSAEGGQICNGGLDEDLYGTGHHSMVENTDTGEWWIVYHRHAENAEYEYVESDGRNLLVESYGRYISVDRVNWVTNILGYEVPCTNGPLKALNWLPESVSGYTNLARAATITSSGAGGTQYLKDEILPFYSSVENLTCTSDGGDMTITLQWDVPVTVHSLMVYNAHDVNAAFSKISNITFKLAKTPEWTTRAYEYAYMTDIAFPERYWDEETGAYMNCAPIVAQFKEITITELTLTIQAEDYLLANEQANACFNLSEIVVLGSNN